MIESDTDYLLRYYSSCARSWQKATYSPVRGEERVSLTLGVSLGTCTKVAENEDWRCCYLSTSHRVYRNKHREALEPF